MEGSYGEYSSDRNNMRRRAKPTIQLTRLLKDPTGALCSLRINESKTNIKQLSNSSSHSNLEMLQVFQNIVLRIMIITPWFVLHSLSKILKIKEEIKYNSMKYSVRIKGHLNFVVNHLLHRSGGVCRLKRRLPSVKSISATSGPKS